MKPITTILALILLTLVSSCTESQPTPAPKVCGVEMPQFVGWPVTEGAAGGGRYSPLTEINRTNVSQLKVVWMYRHGDFRSGGLLPDKYFKGTAFEATPIVVEGRLIFTTPFNRVVTLDPKTGAELWTFNPKIDRGRRFGNMMINRGVAYWLDPNAEGVCASRVFLGTLDARLIALDVKTGKLCRDFGNAGTVNLLDGIQHLVDSWEYNVTSPQTIVGDNVIVGSSIADITRRIMPSGAVRAYNARSGALVWRFNTIPQEGEYGNETWERGSWRHNGAANVWSTMTADLERGLVFLPVSSVGPDLYGGDRPGANLFSDAVVALDAKTGELVWHFQTVHHDIWDYDLAAPPILVRVEHNGREIDAVVQLTKTGLVFVLDRETGNAILPVEERPVPPSDVSGEMAWPTQPFPVKPPPLVPHHLTEDDLWDEDASHLEACKKKLRKLRNEGIFTPPSERGSLLYPGATGGSNWSGGAFDPTSGILYVPTNNLAMSHRLEKLPDANFEKTDGRPMRGGFAGIWWALTGRGTGLRYSMIDRKLLWEGGIMCNRPPWGTLAAVDLNVGDIQWQVPVGEDKNGVRGLFNLGPPLATAGGLVFHGGTTDQRLWAYDGQTGKVLATFELPAGLHAGPISYKLDPDGKQYLVVAPGGHTLLGSRLGDYIIAYTLPDSSGEEIPE